ncbi:MAG: type II toxin-antitoxin system Phd/YefM family antitoxin [Solirubrobacterales bacterium]
MNRVGVAELRQNLSKYLRMVEEGESLVVTDHNVPVARLGPLEGPKSRIDELIAQGRLIPPRKTGPLPRPLSIPGEANAASKALEELRNEERY